MDMAESEVLSYLAFPKADRTHVRPPNPPERLRAEVKRRTDMVGIFVNDATVARLWSMHGCLRRSVATMRYAT
jgi:putative transposase